MTQDQGLAGLLARVEAATGLDRELDFLVQFTLCGDYPDLDWRFGMGQHTAPFTASLDAALALCTRVLPGWRKSVVDLSPDPCEGYVWQTGWGFNIQGKAATPALALIAAMLRALISKSSESGEGDRASRADLGGDGFMAATESKEGH